MLTTSSLESLLWPGAVADQAEALWTGYGAWPAPLLGAQNPRMGRGWNTPVHFPGCCFSFPVEESRKGLI